MTELALRHPGAAFGNLRQGLLIFVNVERSTAVHSGSMGKWNSNAAHVATEDQAKQHSTAE